jgi:hypothetical protein
MRTLVKTTNRKTYIHFDNDFYVTDNNFNNLQLDKIDLSLEQSKQITTIKDLSSWEELESFNSVDEAYKFYAERCKKEHLKRKADREKLDIIRVNEFQTMWENLLSLEVIPATVDNIQILLNYLNRSNWGLWQLPKMNIGYSANQYDCDGVQATTITLDSPVSDEKKGIKNQTKFKVGGKRGHLEKYQTLRTL